MINMKDMDTKYGMKKITRLKSPRIVNLKDFTFPYDSTLHLFTVSDIPGYATRKNPLLKNNKSVVVKTVDKYSGLTLGNFKYRRDKIRHYITHNQKLVGDMKFVKETAKSTPLTRKDLFVYNYGGLAEFYTHSSSPMSTYNVAINNLRTLISNLNKDSSLERNLFVDFDINLPTFAILETLTKKKLTGSLIKQMSSIGYVVYIELWKFFTPETREESVFNDLKIETAKKLNIIFNNSYGSVVNFYRITSIIKDYEDYDYDISNLRDKDFRKVFFIFLNKVYNTTDTIIDEENITEIDAKDSDENVYTEDDLETLGDEDIIDEESLGIEIEKTSKADIDQITTDLNYDDINEVLKDTSKSSDSVKSRISELGKLGVITKNRVKKLNDIIDNQDSIEFEINGKKVKLSEMDKPVDTSINIEDTKITPTIVASENGMLVDTITTLDKKVITEELEPYILKSMLAVRNGNFVITDLKLTNQTDILGSMNTIEMNVENIDGGSAKIKVFVPKVKEDGTFKVNGNTNIMRRQKTDLPIRKISDNQVNLNSAYGKFTVSKASVKRNDIAYWLKGLLSKKYHAKEITNLVVNTGKAIPDVELPQYYTYVNKYIKSFNIGDYKFNFNYTNRDTIVDEELLKELEEYGVVVGLKNKSPLVLTMANKLLMYKKGELVEIDDLFTIIGVDLSEAPIMHSTVKLYRTTFPTILLVGYYLGLENALRLYKVEYSIIGKRDKVEDPVNYYTIMFSDCKLVIKRDFGVNDLLFGGLTSIKKPIKDIPLESFKNRENYSTVFSALELSLLHRNEIILLEDLFVDPMTETLLLEMKEPITFKGLLVRAIEILRMDSYDRPNNIKGEQIRGYNRIASMVYKEMVVALKEQKNKSNFGASKLTVNPYSVLSKINEDSGTVLMDDINPIASLKQIEDITSLGFGGRSKETMSKETRILDKSAIGIISEGGKDSGDVGITAYTTANPKLINTMGMTGDIDFETDGWTSLLSTSAMIAPFGISDDVKRLVFSNIQNSHVIATKNMVIPYVRTGYESVLASRINDKFATVAKGNGIVTKVTKSAVVVEYKDGDKVTKEKHKLYTWFSKEESGTSYSNKVVSNVSVGTKIYKDYVLTYAESFFSPDTYDKSRVVYRQGNVVRTAFIENMESYEDSAAISNSLSKLMSMDSIKSKSSVITTQEVITKVMDIGSKVEHSTPLFSIMDKDFVATDMDEETLEIIQNIKSSSPKAGVRGTIENIKIFYNCDIESMGEELRYYTEQSDKRLLEETGFTGKVNSGHSINGRHLLDNELEIKVFIKVEDDMGIADKAIMGNQLKCTIGDIIGDIKDEDGVPIDLVFSTSSMSKRIVISPVKIGLLSTYMKKTINDAVELFFS